MLMFVDITAVKLAVMVTSKSSGKTTIVTQAHI
jgi:hypothetical protein